MQNTLAENLYIDAALQFSSFFIYVTVYRQLQVLRIRYYTVTMKYLLTRDEYISLISCINYTYTLVNFCRF